MTLAIREIVNRKLGMADKILSVRTTVASDLFLDEFLKWTDVVKQILFATLRSFLLVSIWRQQETLLYFSE